MAQWPRQIASSRGILIGPERAATPGEVLL
jgi:hypothetical protein